MAYLLLTLGMGVRLWSYSGGLSERCLAARSRSGGGQAGITAVLSSLSFEGVTDTARSFAQWRARGRQKRVFVFSDFHERDLTLRSPPSGSLFLIRYRTPFTALAEMGAELEVLDPESGRLIVVPWSQADEAAWKTGELARDTRMAAAPRSFFRRLEADSPRAPVYWDILERLYA